MRILEKIGRRLCLPGSQAAYSQFGEDLIIHHLFRTLGIPQPKYLDIGANHPKFISNTYFFYQRGSRGVLIEPNPRLSRRLRRARPQDTVLEVGIGLTPRSQADFYVFPSHADGLSTFSKEEAAHWQTVGMKGYGKIPVEAVIQVPLVPVNEVIASHFQGRGPNLLSLDIEGLDLEVLKSLDFARFAPDVICVETLSYDDQQRGYKRADIIDFARAQDYDVYADTWVNTIFCRAGRVQATS
jgi:FkbM family methyltransferase